MLTSGTTLANEAVNELFVDTAVEGWWHIHNSLVNILNAGDSQESGGVMLVRWLNG